MFLICITMVGEGGDWNPDPSGSAFCEDGAHLLLGAFLPLTEASNGSTLGHTRTDRGGWAGEDEIYRLVLYRLLLPVSTAKANR